MSGLREPAAVRGRVRLFFLTRAAAARLPAKLYALHSRLWLLVLDPSDLDAITMVSYSDRAGSGFASEDHNLHALWPWEVAAIGQYLTPSSRILVAGAGGGREMIALARAGHEVVGFDATPDLVDAARRNLRAAGVSGKIYYAPPGEIAADLDHHDAIIIGRGMYHHVPRRARRIAFLRGCRSKVDVGDPLIIGDFLIREDRGTLPTKRNSEFGDSVGSAFFHRFTEDEIASELREAGFELVDFRITPYDEAGGLAHAIARATD